MSAIKLVSRLDHCRQTREGEWVARCPAHEDKSPSLSISESSDGRVLLHCHAGCGAIDVLTAVGLDWDELFPPSDRNYHAERKNYSRTVDELVVEIASADMSAGKSLTVDDRDRCREALHRLDNGEKSPDSDSREDQRNSIIVAGRESQRLTEIRKAS